jgi:hypothetical protein
MQDMVDGAGSKGFFAGARPPKSRLIMVVPGQKREARLRLNVPGIPCLLEVACAPPLVKDRTVLLPDGNVLSVLRHALLHDGALSIRRLAISPLLVRNSRASQARRPGVLLGFRDRSIDGETKGRGDQTKTKQSCRKTRLHFHSQIFTSKKYLTA